MFLGLRCTAWKILAWILISCCQLSALGQQKYYIQGKVTDKNTGEVLPFASVFLSQTTMGNTSDEQGTYKIGNVPPGTYDLVVQYLGYQNVVISLNVQDQSILLNIALEKKANNLGEVVVKAFPDATKSPYYGIFKMYFLGESKAAKACKILNPELIDLDYDNLSRVLRASSEDFLIIENPTLGYRVKFLLHEFAFDYKQQMTFYYGNPFFEPMSPRNARQQRTWERNRLKTYLGSSMHYLRSLRLKRLQENGFETRKIVRVERKQFNGAVPLRLFDQDSTELKMIRGKNRGFILSKTVEYLYPGIVPYDSIFHPGAPGNVDTLHFKNILQVTYTKGWESEEYQKAKGLTPDRRAQQTSLFYLLRETMPFDDNGNLAYPAEGIFSGYWGWSKFAEMLPLDYQPNIKTKQ
ncbi:hypothetical protein COR50_10595 [Chitinophaga caeni]|uniref:Carboxypeptidase-like regulatory domain-containing protein n=1 Tax=Chitinophaga caeni TaxID=2029983 RepID=A0A291QUE0_9BACT|nr:carboxypeptidase-like regulatory domain-containing protein [Chitinophaga caeni]ATL47580.1 hypothetical protein COR50_10595 [Chitinophaga caeni]